MFACARHDRSGMQAECPSCAEESRLALRGGVFGPPPFADQSPDLVRLLDSSRPLTTAVADLADLRASCRSAAASLDDVIEQTRAVLKETTDALSRDGQVALLQQTVTRLLAERDEARARAGEMHRRSQLAESVAQPLIDGRPQGPAGRSLGRALANLGAAQQRDRAEMAEAERDAARAVLRACEWVQTACPVPCCPSCGHMRETHAADCALVAALGALGALGRGGGGP